MVDHLLPFTVVHAYLIALLPLAASLIIFFFGDWLPMKGAWLGILAMAVSLMFSIDIFMCYLDTTLKLPYEMSWSWFSVGIYPFEWGVLLDGPSIIMLLVVTTVSLLVQIYSLGYMHDAPRFKRFYAFLSLFTFSMLILVLSNNYLQFFIGWELMGACSYFLISFEFEREAAGIAGNKAFLTTRLGDLGFYAGLLTIFYVVGTFNFGQINAHIADGSVSAHISMIIAVMLFCGAAGKSAQLPLHVWLPDAMEGPTPVSALIHSATMVAAGVFLVGRSYSFFVHAPDALTMVAWIGGCTAFFAATIALVSTDVKKMLAYSTISQLGYMMLAMGVLGYSAGLFHMTTHAAFKALLFLGAGSIIHAAHTNDMWKMGSLSKQMVITCITFFVGAAALSGFPLTAGFFSKDMILAAVYQSHQTGLFVLGVLTAFMTAFYVTRACVLVFLGEPRERDRFAHAHESPWTMTVPLIILAVFAATLGLIMKHMHMPEELLGFPAIPEIQESSFVQYCATGAALSGIVFGVILYLNNLSFSGKIASAFRPIHQFLVHKWYVDEVYQFLFVKPTLALSRGIAAFDTAVIDRIFVDGFGWIGLLLSKIGSWFDDQIVDGTVNATGWTARGAGSLVSRIQSGLVQNYILVITLGFIALMFAGKLF